MKSKFQIADEFFIFKSDFLTMELYNVYYNFDFHDCELSLNVGNTDLRYLENMVLIPLSLELF